MGAPGSTTSRGGAGMSGGGGYGPRSLPPSAAPPLPQQPAMGYAQQSAQGELPPQQHGYPGHPPHQRAQGRRGGSGSYDGAGAGGQIGGAENQRRGGDDAARAGMPSYL